MSQKCGECMHFSQQKGTDSGRCNAPIPAWVVALAVAYGQDKVNVSYRIVGFHCQKACETFRASVSTPGTRDFR
jgi:hypothetical protein